MAGKQYLKDPYHRQHLAEVIEDYVALHAKVREHAAEFVDVPMLNPRDRAWLGEVVAELGGTGND
jgi:hypothetical protein